MAGDCGGHPRASPVGRASDPRRLATGSRTRGVFPHLQLRACWLLADDAVLEARLRADTGFYQGCADVERFIRHYLARSRWVNDGVRRAALHEASVVLQVG